MASGADVRRVCDDARLSISLALDDALDDETREGLWEHLGACEACARLAAELGYATSLVRSTSLEPFRCDLTTPRLLRSRLDARSGPWTSAAVVLGALVLVVWQLPGGAGTPGEPPSARSQGAFAAPFRLPIGQRSAADDFGIDSRGSRRPSAADAAPRTS